MKLPSLILDTQPAAVLQMLARVSGAREASIEFDAIDLTALEPVGICLLASCADRAGLAGKRIVIRNGCPTLERLLTAARFD